jgi:TetR/AcrR family transcriptional repressor of bet genes
VPKIVDHDQRRKEIVRDARSVIAKDGAEALTLRRLAEQGGLAHGALRRYFRFKDDVLLALEQDLEERFTTYADREEYWVKRGLPALQTLLNGILPLDDERRVSIEVMNALREHAMSDPEFAKLCDDRMTTLFTRIKKHLQEAADEGEISGALGIEVTAAILINTIVGISLTTTLRDSPNLASYDSLAVQAILAAA